MTARNRRHGTGAWIPHALSAGKRAVAAWIIFGNVVLVPLALWKVLP